MSVTEQATEQAINRSTVVRVKLLALALGATASSIVAIVCNGTLMRPITARPPSSLMWVGMAMQATGVAGWASAYFYATDPGLERRIGGAVIEAANNDQAHLFAFLVPGALAPVTSVPMAAGAIGLEYYLW
jgi:hypothetical protein